jgi:plastocyanin
MLAHPEKTVREINKGLLLGLRVLGGLLLLTSAGIHAYLYFQNPGGYRHIPTIGWLFLIQIIVAALLGLAVLVIPNRLVAAAGAAFAVGTLVGYEIFRVTTIFNFHEVRTTLGFWAGLVESLVFACLGAYATMLPPTDKEAAHTGTLATLLKLFANKLSLAIVGIGTVGLIVVVALSALPKTTPSTGTSSTTSVPKGGMTVTIQNFSFSPKDFTVTPGETISVTNKDPVTHNFTSVAAGGFNSGPINSGQTVTVKAPTTPGTYPYKCTIHPFMTGTVTVS